MSSHARCKRSDALSDPLLILAIAEKQPSVHLFPSQCTPEEFHTEITRVKALIEDVITTLSPSGRAAWDEVFNFGSKDQINYAVRQVQDLVCAMGDGMKRDSKGFRSSSTARTIWLRKDQALPALAEHGPDHFNPLIVQEIQNLTTTHARKAIIDLAQGGIAAVCLQSDRSNSIVPYANLSRDSLACSMCQLVVWPWLQSL